MNILGYDNYVADRVRNISDYYCVTTEYYFEEKNEFLTLQRVQKKTQHFEFSFKK